MKTIDLTSPAKAIAHLRTLPPGTSITLPDRHDAAPHSSEADAVSVASGVPCYEFAAAHNRWEWTISDLLEELPGTTMMPRIPRPPLSTESLPNYREWTDAQRLEHLQRIKDLAEEGISAIQSGKELESTDTVRSGIDCLFDEISTIASKPTW